jgi:hypothetical protein
VLISPEGLRHDRVVLDFARHLAICDRHWSVSLSDSLELSAIVGANRSAQFLHCSIRHSEPVAEWAIPSPG